MSHTIPTKNQGWTHWYGNKDYIKIHWSLSRYYWYIYFSAYTGITTHGWILHVLLVNHTHLTLSIQSRVLVVQLGILREYIYTYYISCVTLLLWVTQCLSYIQYFLEIVIKMIKNVINIQEKCKQYKVQKTLYISYYECLIVSSHWRSWIMYHVTFALSSLCFNFLKQKVCL